MPNYGSPGYFHKQKQLQTCFEKQSLIGASGHLILLFQGLPVGQSIPSFSLKFSQSRFALWTQKPEKCASAAAPSLASGFSPQTPALPGCQISLKDRELVTPRVSSVAKSASESSIPEPQILPTAPAQHPASTESSVGLKHVRSQDKAAKSRGPKTKHL